MGCGESNLNNDIIKKESIQIKNNLLAENIKREKNLKSCYGSKGKLMDSLDSEKEYQWSNKAGVSWSLNLTKSDSVLIAPDNAPYPKCEFHLIKEKNTVKGFKLYYNLKDNIFEEFYKISDENENPDTIISKYEMENAENEWHYGEISKIENYKFKNPIVEQLLSDYNIKLNEIDKVNYEAIDLFLELENLFNEGRFSEGLDLLKDFWKRFPKGTYYGLPFKGQNFGLPTCYYANLMSLDVFEYFSKKKGDIDFSYVNFTVVLIGESKGTFPPSKEAAKSKKYTKNDVSHYLNNDLTDDKILPNFVLFNNYIEAITQGKLKVKLNIVRLNNLCVPVEISINEEGRHFSSMTGNSWELIEKALSEEILEVTDWWMILYPRFTPTEDKEIYAEEYVTGGMGSFNSGPVWIADDEWLIKKPPHLGKGNYSPEELRCYFPQWLQHEFFHHLFHIFNEFKLEEKDHQWFNKDNWPKDFEGDNEPDYYYEALHKRLLNAKPSLFERLKKPNLKKMSSNEIINKVSGLYEKEKVENDWNIIEINLDNYNKWEWKNKAGVKWSLENDFENSLFYVGIDCPYFDSCKEVKIRKEDSDNSNVILLYNGEKFIKK